MELDGDRPLTAYQLRVLLLLRVFGPITFSDLSHRIDQAGPQALRFALWRLCRGGWAWRRLDPDRLLSCYDCTDAGRAAIRDRLAG